MDLETAQEIIEQEALLILIANPNLRFGLIEGWLLSDIFCDKKSKVVTIYERYCRENMNIFTFKIDHPKHSIGYYTVTGYDNPETMEVDWYTVSIGSESGSGWGSRLT